jgi:hypothetical protein
VIDLDHLKGFVHLDREKESRSLLSSLLPLLVTLVSGLVIIVSISPLYLRELHPFTLLLLSVCSALPVWAFNQLLWWLLGRRVSCELVKHVVLLFDISPTERRALSFALGQLMKVLDVMRFIPSKRIADLVTVVTIYLGVVVTYFTLNSLALLYGVIFLLGLAIWSVGLWVLHRACRKIDAAPIKAAWEQLRHNDALLAQLNHHFETIETLIRARTRTRTHKHGEGVPSSAQGEGEAAE